MTTKIQKWGNSLAVRVPKTLAKHLKLKAGTTVSLVQKARSFEVLAEPVKKGKYTLEELVARITRENRHEEIDWGKPVGKEVW